MASDYTSPHSAGNVIQPFNPGNQSYHDTRAIEANITAAQSGIGVSWADNPKFVSLAEAQARAHQQSARDSAKEAFKTPKAAALPTDSQARKDTPIFSGVLHYFPLALAEVARLSKFGNDKHNPGQPLHWSRDKSTDHADCIVRHQMEVGTRDEFGFLHEVSVAWRALAQLQIALEAK